MTGSKRQRKRLLRSRQLPKYTTSNKEIMDLIRSSSIKMTMTFIVCKCSRTTQKCQRKLKKTYMVKSTTRSRTETIEKKYEDKKREKLSCIMLDNMDTISTNINLIQTMER
jgi:DNA repair protein RadC